MSTELIPTQTNGKALAPAASPPAAPVPQYAQGFEGAASAPFPPDAAKILGEAVKPEEVETKPNGIVYLPGVWYRRQLTRAFGAGAWALLPRGPARTMGEIVVYHGALYILGRFVSEAFGECETRFGMSYASSLEGARTDALTRCCKDLGMATELWDPEWRGAWQAKWCSKTWEEAKGNKKAGYVFKKLDKPNRAPDPVAGRNVGPTAAALDATAQKLAAELKETPSDASELGLSVGQGEASAPETAGAGGQAAVSPDTGEVASAGDVELLRTQVKKMRWAAPRARSWLNNLFGTSKAENLTKDQAASALVLLLAASTDDANSDDNNTAYGAAYERLKADGKVS
ncbi:MAG TPA: hypothetical protein VFI42_15960 [Thermomicrobiaceae bacterium]|nr:hypothetical protein [Thermomicrobiaceae bacterium]